MRYPAFLPPGGTVAFAAPSFGAVIEPYHTAFLAAKSRLEGRGFKTLTGPNVDRSDGVGKSSTPENCGRELNELFTRSGADLIWSVGGGELMCEDLPFVDFEGIRTAPPKWFMGYSDNTNMTFLLPTLCDTAAVYGPCAPTFGMEPLHESLEDALDLVTGRSLRVHSWPLGEKEQAKCEEDPLAPYNLTEKTVMKAANWDGKPFAGRFLGGCLDCLVNLCGTRFDRVKEFNRAYGSEGIVWFLEACDLTPFSLRRAFWQLKEAGWFESAKAFLLGRPAHFGEEAFSFTMDEAAAGILEPFGVPLLSDLDIGHLPPPMPLMSGGYGTVGKAGDGLGIEFTRR